MTYYYPPSMEQLIHYLAKLPGVGPKTATRLALFLLNASAEDATGLASAILEARDKVRHCEVCGNLTDEAICPVCNDPRRDHSKICVIQQPADAVVIEKSGAFDGMYHVLHGALSPMEGIGPEDLNIAGLLKRLQAGDVHEVIMATNTGVEGEATALYLAKLIRPLGISVSRIAHGVPVGGDLEYTDEVTLARALTGRKSI